MNQKDALLLKTRLDKGKPSPLFCFVLFQIQHRQTRKRKPSETERGLVKGQRLEEGRKEGRKEEKEEKEEKEGW